MAIKLQNGTYVQGVQFYANKEGEDSIVVRYFEDDTKAKVITPDEYIVVNGNAEKILSLGHKFDLEDIPNGTPIKKALYDVLGAKYKAAGLEPESDESGSWVKY